MSRCSATTSAWPTWPAGILTPDPALADQLSSWVAAADNQAAAVAAVVQHVGRRTGIEVAFAVDGERIDPSPAVLAVPVDDAVVDDWGPWLPGFVREVVTAALERHDQGVHHTPPGVVDAVLDLVEHAGVTWTASTTVLDPSVGGGAFLLGAAERMPGPRASIVARLRGVDIDPLAVAATRAALTLWAGVEPPAEALRVGDFLTAPADLPVDVVVGNPPFLGQLKGGTPRDDARRRTIAERWPGVGRYVDEAVTFALASVDAVVDGGAVALVQPASVLGATDAEAARRHLDAVAPPVGVWVDHGRAFAAAVDTVAIVLGRGASTEQVAVGGEVVARPAPTSWAPLLAASSGVPVVDVGGDRSLADLATVTAGFRDQFYGLRGAVDDDPHGRHRLITSGSIDPLHCRWGERPTRFDREAYRCPVVDLDRVDPAVVRWVRARLVPKVLVASQTKVVEAIADPDGGMVPGTPVVSVEPHDRSMLWHLAALLTSPVATALLVQDAAGTALSADAVRVSARLLAALPLPADPAAWDVAASQAEAGDAAACGRTMLDAHGVGDREDLFSWWLDRMPTNSPGI